MNDKADQENEFVALFNGVTASKAFEIAKYIDGLLDQQKRKEAIAFAEWIAVKNYTTTTLPHEPEQLWEVVNYPGLTPHDTNEITTTQLYDLYLHSLTPQP